MDKKRVFASIFYSGLLLSILVFLLIYGVRFTGFATYGGGNPFCGAEVTDASNSFTADQDCGSGTIVGGNITTADALLNCAGFRVAGDGGSVNTFGIKTSAHGITLRRCNVQSFGWNLNISGNTTIVDTRITTGAVINETWLNVGINATFVNVTYTETKIQHSTGSNAIVQYYAIVNITNATGTGAVTGANVSVFNASTFATRVNATTASNGLVYFNITERVKNLTGDTEFIYWINVSAGGQYNESFGVNLAATGNYQYINISVPAPDTTAPRVTIVNPQNTSYGSPSFPLIFNVTLNENGSIVMYSLDNGVNNFTMSVNATGTGYNGTNGSIADGQYVFRVFANDSAGNRNDTVNVTFVVDRTAPRVTIISPTGTLSSNSYSINISLNENGTARYSLNAGLTNFTMTANSTGTGHNASRTGDSDGAYTISFYVNDTLGNNNFTFNASFTISTPSSGGGSGSSGGGGGGGGALCEVKTWNCGGWGLCANGNQTRECTSDCKSKKTEIQQCVPCANECDIGLNTGNYCSGNNVVKCELVQGCYKIRNASLCSAGEQCNNGTCIVLGNENGQQIRNDIKQAIERISGFFTNIPRPSDFIPHGNIPAVVVDVAVGGTAVGVVAGTSWLSWLWLLTLILPIFAIKLRHYSISVFDSDNALKMINKGRIDSDRLLALLKTLENSYSQLLCVSRSDEVVKYLVNKGCIEVRLDEPFIITGHFTSSKDAFEFREKLRFALNTSGGSRVRILESTERASIIGAWRAYQREKQTRRELEKLFRK